MRLSEAAGDTPTGQLLANATRGGGNGSGSFGAATLAKGWFVRALLNDFVLP